MDVFGRYLITAILLLTAGLCVMAIAEIEPTTIKVLQMGLASFAISLVLDIWTEDHETK